MNTAPVLPAMTILQTETFERIARDVALFEDYRLLTDRCLAEARSGHIRPCPVPATPARAPEVAA